MTIINDGWLLSPEQWIQGIILWEIALISSRFCWFHETSPAKNSLLLLAVLDSKILNMNKYWATFSVFLFYDWCLKYSFQVWSCILDKSFLACCLMNMLLCHYLIPKECGDSKVLFSKLQLATYIYSIHYIFPFEFILGYIIHRLVVVIIIIIIII